MSSIGLSQGDQSGHLKSDLQFTPYNPTKFKSIYSSTEAKIDCVLDAIPFVSTISNIAAIIFKMIMSCCCCKPSWKNKRYFEYWQDKSYLECLCFILPGVNLVMSYIRIYLIQKANINFNRKIITRTKQKTDEMEKRAHDIQRETLDTNREISKSYQQIALSRENIDKLVAEGRRLEMSLDILKGRSEKTTTTK